MGKRKITVALAGNPNSGKTTVFNNLTGARQHVGNYPGVTVEKKEGSCIHDDVEMNVVDLPGTYSLTAYSVEEVIARNFVVDEKPDVVVDIVDASNLERNLYLATQFMELNAPLVLAFNMIDMAEKRGYQIDTEPLSQLIGVPIVPTVGTKGQGMEELKDAIITAAEDHRTDIRAEVRYGREIEEEIRKIVPLLERESRLTERYSTRWLAVKLLENDSEVRDRVQKEASDRSAIFDAVQRSTEHLESILGDHPEISIADQRYGYISGVCQETVRSTVEARHEMSDRIDFVLANRVLGLPIFLGLMYLAFQLTFALAEVPMGWIETFFGWLGNTVTDWWPVGSESALKSLLVDGIIGGVGGVLVFVPNILLLFLAIAVLEDSGYMARAAFIMDKVMHKIGLHGKSFIPMLIGFGCSAPAIMATRTLRNRQNRPATMFIVPLMSCGARIPIYALIIPAFFPQNWRGPMLWIIYMTGIVLAIAVGKLLHIALFKGAATPFVMELPPYQMPTLKGITIHMWERAGLYIRKAGTIILGISIILWALTSYPKIPESKVVGLSEEEVQESALTYSVAGRIGHALEPVIRPLGFDWRIGTALIGAFAAKEVFVAQMGIVYAVGEADEGSESLREQLRARYTPLVAFCIMLFCLISAPCMATIAITKRESNSWRWALFQLGGLTVLAYVVTLIVYQVGTLLGIGTTPI